MPNITSSGTYDKHSEGFKNLGATDKPRHLLFNAGNFGSSCHVRYRDDEGAHETFEDGIITAGPKTFTVPGNIDAKIVVNGSPSFNVTII